VTCNSKEINIIGMLYVLVLLIDTVLQSLSFLDDTFAVHLYVIIPYLMFKFDEKKIKFSKVYMLCQKLK
jgi:hypothetical protein